MDVHNGFISLRGNLTSDELNGHLKVQWKSYISF